jgi:hypothetical protein
MPAADGRRARLNELPEKCQAALFVFNRKRRGGVMKKVLQGTGGMVFSFLLRAGMLTSLAMAQLPTATILGVVKDSSGAVVPDTTLTARNVETGQTRTATSAADGSYRFSALPVGGYEVRAEHSGFQAEVRSGLTLTVSQEAVVNFSLQVGAVTETVSVTAEAPLVNTTSGSLGGLVNEQRMADLPLNGRNYQDLTLLQPGVTQYRNYNVTLINSAGYNGTLYSSNGAGFRSNSFLLDGASMVNAWGNSSATTTNTTLGVEGYREYRVLTNSFTAEYGMTMGSQMIIVSKSGANAWHGSAFEYLRNSALDARNFFDYKSAASQRRLPSFTRNDFGGSFGGPIKKDKTFFFGVFEDVQARTGVTQVSRVLAAGCHGPAGAVITNVQCPQLGSTAQATIAATAAPFLALLPTPNLPGNLFTFPYSTPEADYFGQIRVDQTFSADDSFFARYTIQDSSQTPNITYPGFAVAEASRGQYITLSETHVFSPTVLNTARLSYSRSPLSENSPFLISGPQYSYIPGRDMGQLVITGAIDTYGPSGLTPLLFSQNLFALSDDMFYTHGRHSLKFGTLINRYQQFYNSGNATRGTLTFASAAGFLQGAAQNINITVPGHADLYRVYRFYTLGFYVQDDLRLSSKLTLNVGLRYEPSTQVNEKSGRGSSVRDIQHDSAPTLGEPPFLNPSKRDFSPRLGFAWDVMGDGKTSVRGGAALLYDVAAWGSMLATDSAALPPYSFQATFNFPSQASANFTIPLALTSTPPQNTIAFKIPDYHMQQPHMLQYNLTVERQLPGSMALTLGYAGSRGINIVMMTDGNPTVPNGIPTNGVCVARPTGQAYNINAPSCWISPATANPRTNPNFGPILYQNAGGNSWYNALQFGLLKRMTKGLQFQSSYTWAKAMDTTQGQIQADTTVTSPNPSDPVHRNVDRSVTSFDVTQNWRFNAIYNLPQYSSLHGAAAKLVNGWWMSGILSLQTGYPFTPQLGSNRSLSGTNGGNNIDRPNLAPGRTVDNIEHGVSTSNGIDPCPTAGLPLGTRTLWYDPCAFVIQPAGFLGNSGRNILRGPGFTNLDFSLVKDTSIRALGEAGRLQFRAEIFNILNHANFAMPATGFNAVYAAGSPAGVESPLATAGLITSTVNNSRQIQFALKLLF